MEQDKEGIRIDINTPVLEVVNLQTFFDLNLVVNNTEIPPQGILRTRSDMWYTANQDHYYRTPGNTSQEGDHSNLLNEEPASTFVWSHVRLCQAGRIRSSYL